MQEQLLLFEEEAVICGAVFSPCRKWRYSLWRIWDRKKPMVLFVGLNPSTATETENDPTVTRCINYAMDWGYGGMYMGNIFAYRATAPKDMKDFDKPVGLENDHWLVKMHEEAGLTVAAWGNDGAHLDREKQVLELLDNLHCLTLTKKNHPWHPLYLSKELKPIKFDLKDAA